MSIHVPVLVPGGGSCRSLVSQITFYEESDDDLSQMSSTSFKCNNKWYAERELCHFRIALHENNTPTAETRTASSKPIEMPERKCSTNGLFDLPVTGETKYATLRNSLLGTRKSKQQQGSTLSPIPQEPRAKMGRLSPIPQEASKGRMANAKWDVPETEKSTRSRSTVGTLLSTLTSSSAGGSSSGASPKRTSFTRISMAGALHGSMPLKKPTRQVSNGSPEFPSLKKTHQQHHSVVSQRRTYPPPLSTMPLTMPIRKPSTQDLLNLPSSGSTNALRKKLSRSKLHQGGAYNSMMMVIPRRVSSTSSMARNQSRDLLWRYG